MIYLVLALGLIFRLILINQSFWLDEGASLVMARLPLSGLFSALTNDFHPPLYYLFLHYWLKFGITSEWFLRLPNVLFGVLSIFFLFQFLNEIKTKNTLVLPLLGALLLALNPLHIYYSQELRMYSLNVLLTILTWTFLNRKNYSLWTLFSLLNLYTFYGSFFNLFAQLVFIFIFHRKSFSRTLTFCLIPVALFLPWVSTLKLQLAGGEYLKTALPEWTKLSGNLDLKSLALIPLKFTLGRLNLSTDKLYLFSSAITTLYFFSLIFVALKHKLSRPFLFWFSLPIICGLVISLKTPVLGYWRYLYLLPAFSALIALGLSLLPRKLRLVNLFVVIVTLVLANCLFWFNRSSHREDWRSAVKFAANRNSVENTTLFAFPDAFAPVHWYAPDLKYTAALNKFNATPEELDQRLSSSLLGIKEVVYFNYLSVLTDPSGNISSWLTNAGFVKKQTVDFPGVGFVDVYTVFKSRN